MIACRSPGPATPQAKDAKQTMMRPTAASRWVLPLLLLGSVCLLAACGSQTPTPAPTPTVSLDTLADAPAIELAPDVQAAIEAMGNLPSYRTRTTYEFREQPMTGTLTTGIVDILVEYTQTPVAAQRIVMTDTTAPEDDETRTSQTVRIGNTTWYDMGDGNWVEAVEEPGTPFQSAGLIYDAPDLLVSAQQAQKVGSETVNGILSDRYTFAQDQLPAFASGEMDRATGEFWIARDGGYITRYSLQAAGDDIELSEGVRGRGTMALTYDLSEVGQTITITAPSLTDAGPVGFAPGTFPLPNDARPVLRSRDFMSYVSEQPLGEVAAFYEDQLSTLGWRSPEGSGYSAPELINLVFVQGNNQILITITTDTETGQTQILVSSEQVP